MKERPILFSTPMVQAILEGRKTMTRRIIKPQPTNGLQKGLGDPGWYDTDFECVFHTGKYIQCKYGDIGDLLWVRETWCYPNLFDGFEKDYYFKAGFSSSDIKDRNASGLWKPYIHMPKEAARIWLQVEEIRVERLHDISEEDAIAEGIDSVDQHDKKLWKRYDGYNSVTSSPVVSFWSLWASINGEESWNANPWVWVVKFKILSTTGRPEIAPG